MIAAAQQNRITGAGAFGNIHLERKNENQSIELRVAALAPK